MQHSFFYERLAAIDKAFAALPPYHLRAGANSLEAVREWYREIGAHMLNRVAVEAAGEDIGPIPIRNLMDFPEGMRDEDIVKVCKEYGDTAIFFSNGIAYLAV